MNTKQLIIDLEDGVHIVYPSKCHLWKGKKTKTGYGAIRIRGAAFTVRRVLWFLKYGYLPQGVCMTDTCGNPACCNIDHIQDNTPVGERRKELFRSTGFNAPHIKPENVMKVYGALLMGETTYRAAAKRWGVSQKTLRKHVKKFESGL